MLAAPPAIFLDLDLFRGLPLITGFIVIAALAVRAGQRYLFAHEASFLK
jgi:hypothetical protein